jgi:hypothetical protein
MFQEILYRGISLWFTQTTEPSSLSLFMPGATSAGLLPVLWQHHWKTKQILYVVLNCRGVRQGAACCSGAQGVVLMSSMNSELTVVCGRAQLAVVVHRVWC